MACNISDGTIAYDNGLVVFRVHHDTTYFVQSCRFFSHRVASAIALHHAKTDNEIPKCSGACSRGVANDSFFTTRVSQKRNYDAGVV